MDMPLNLDLFYFDNLISIYALLFYADRVQSHCLYLLRFLLYSFNFSVRRSDEDIEMAKSVYFSAYAATTKRD